MKKYRAIITSLVAGAAFAGCNAADAPGSGASSARPAHASADRPAGYYALGRPPTAAEIAAWDRDIEADGGSLPPGRGSARDGADIYRTKCASCHGANGEGMGAAFPALVGRDPRGEAFDFASDPAIERTIGNYWSHATTLYDYIRRAMPLDSPGSLSDEQTYAVTAFLLAANEVVAADAVLDAAALRAVRMPARDRFIADDRPNGPGVR
jgi:S-disulfanyl-L-cysteine oxidoreductase SoxD